MAKTDSRSIGKILVIAFMFGLGLWMAMFHGERYPPFVWVMRLQIALFGAAATQITLLVGILLIIGPMLGLRAGYRRLRYGVWSLRPIETPAAAAVSAGSETPVSTPSEGSRGNDVTNPWSQSLLWVGIMGLLFLGMGLHGWYRAQSSTERAHCSAEDIHRGALPASRWVRVHATPQPDLMVGTEENHVAWFYIPLVPDNWTKEQGVSLVIRMRDTEITPELRIAEAADFDGMLQGSDMKAFVEQEFERTGVPLNSDYQLLSANRTPEDEGRAARFFVPAGGVCVLISAGGLLWRIRKSRRGNSPSPTGPGAPELTIKRILGGGEAAPPPTEGTPAAGAPRKPS